jgi:hypothetical protein
MLGLSIQKIYKIPHSNTGDLADMDEKEKENSHYGARARTAAVEGAVGPGSSGKGSGRCYGRRWLGAVPRGRGRRRDSLGKARRWRHSRGRELGLGHEDGADVTIGLKSQEGRGAVPNARRASTKARLGFGTRPLCLLGPLVQFSHPRHPRVPNARRALVDARLGFSPPHYPLTQFSLQN